MNNVNKLRRQLCTTINQDFLSKPVCLAGWVHNRRDHGGIIFIDHRDTSGLVQLVFDPSLDETAHKLAGDLRSEFVIQVSGTVRKRSAETVNEKMPTGQWEVVVQHLEILNKSQTLPFSINENQVVNAALQLEYRYLDLRRPKLQQHLKTRSHALQVIRQFFTQQQFLEIETPFLIQSTPEGARDYLVPSRKYQGSFFSLPQSPQLFKQLLMVGGLERYFQIVRCFRDEDLRQDRQPEFTQIDVELSFTNQAEVFDLIESMFKDLLEKVFEKKLKTPFQQMSYAECIEKYGTDKPDLRFDLSFKDVTQIVQHSQFKVFTQAVAQKGVVKAICVKQAGFSRKQLDDLTQLAISHGAKGMAWVKLQTDGWQSPIAKFFTQAEQQSIEQQTEATTGDILLFGAGPKDLVNQVLDKVRQTAAKYQGLVDEQQFCFAWITDFPLMIFDADKQSYQSSHHPFTLPNPDDYQQALPKEQMRAVCYDLVLNGCELGSGSMRIFESEMQEQIFEWLNIPAQEARQKFGFFLDALKYGAPPHGGIALGLDRMLMLLLGAESIREVIAFPKTQQSNCLLSKAPAPVSEQQLAELGLKLKTSAKKQE